MRAPPVFRLWAVVAGLGEARMLDTPLIRVLQACRPRLHLHAGKETITLNHTDPVRLRQPVDRSVGNSVWLGNWKSFTCAD